MMHKRPDSIQIIAEIANGSEGNIEQGLLLLRAAAKATADAAKYQVIYADELCTPDYKNYELFRTLEMADSAWRRLMSEAGNLGVELILDVFGGRSLSLAENLGVRDIMVHATDLTNMPLLDKIGSGSWRNVLLGVGGARRSEIEQAVHKLTPFRIVLMVGYQGYPTPDEENQIDRVRCLKELFSPQPNVQIGFSDHSLPESSLTESFSAMALGLGARVFEKHLTLGESMMLVDHHSAINPDKFLRFTSALRACQIARGRVSEADDFGMLPAEIRYREMVRRSVVTTAHLSSGSVLSLADLVLKRSPNKSDFSDIEVLVGRRLRRDVAKDCALSMYDIEQ